MSIITRSFLPHILRLHKTQKLQNQINFKKNLFTVNSTEEKKKTIELCEQDLLESFVKGSGNGGQKINTTSNCVDLKHIPTGIRVQCQKTRSLQQNRNIARKILMGKLDNYYNGELSEFNLKKEKVRKQQLKRKKRIKEKYGDRNDRNKVVMKDLEDLELDKDK